jgi:hypothetical protein
MGWVVVMMVVDVEVVMVGLEEGRDMGGGGGVH